MTETVAIIGATDRKSAYANMAMHSLLEHGHEVVLVNPLKKEIEGRKCYASIADFEEKIDTVTVYVNPKRFSGYVDDLIKVKPKRIIMNPGTENDADEAKLVESGIQVLRECTLVLLSTGQF